MATAITIEPLVPRPFTHAIASWSSSSEKCFAAREEAQPALKRRQKAGSTTRFSRERPCDGCRRRGSKCIIQDLGHCVLCDSHKQSCTFVGTARPRKRKAEELMESKAAAIRRNTPSSTSSSAVSSPEQRVAAPNEGGSSRLRSPPAFDQSLSLQPDKYYRYVGPTTSLDNSLIGFGHLDSPTGTTAFTRTLRQVSETEFFSIHADTDVGLLADEARARAEIDAVVGEYGTTLIEIYFRNVHSNYPIIQKNASLDEHKRGDRPNDPSLLAAIYLLALQWWSTEPDLAQQPKPDANRLEHIAFTSLTVAMQRPKLSAVQAGLLLLRRSNYSTWALTVQLVALSQELGLHLDCSSWSIPVWERRLRKRLAWALYMQDKWSALVHGRPSHVSADDWVVPLPTPDDFNDSAYSTDGGDSIDEVDLHGRTLYIQLIALTGIMSEVCQAFYSQKAKQDFGRVTENTRTQLVLSRAKPVQVKLKEWYAQLPPQCRMDSFTPSILSGNGYLHLAYFATEISIHRCIIQSLRQGASDSYMMYICRLAAKTRLIGAMDFVNRLRSEHLESFWYFPSTSNFALIGTFGALLAATSPGKEEAEFYQNRLQEFRWTLCVSAKKAAWIGEAVHILDADLEMLRGLPDKPSAAEQKFGTSDHDNRGSPEVHASTLKRTGHPMSADESESLEERDFVEYEYE